jgi:hypothetical protein
MTWKPTDVEIDRILDTPTAPGLPEWAIDRTPRPRPTAGDLLRSGMTTFLAVIGLLCLLVLALAALGVLHP